MLVAAGDMTAKTSAPCLISSLAIIGHSTAATLPVTQRTIFFPLRTLLVVPLITFEECSWKGDDHEDISTFTSQLYARRTVLNNIIYTLTTSLITILRTCKSAMGVPGGKYYLQPDQWACLSKQSNPTKLKCRK
jgi:hypothetical protein